MLIRMRFAVLSIGLVLIAGAILASLVTFWVRAGVEAADLKRDTELVKSMPSPGAMWTYFVDNVLFVGELPGWLFWIGVLVSVIGIVVMLRGGRSEGDGELDPADLL
jgi:hypothetical protein